jgi:hypothetical protein
MSKCLVIMDLSLLAAGMNNPAKPAGVERLDRLLGVAMVI